MSNRARDGFRRIAIFQPRSGWVADMVAGQFGPTTFDQSEEYFDTGQGRRQVVSRSRKWSIPVVDLDVARQLMVMQKEGCEVQAIGIGWNYNMVWLSSSAINVIPYRTNPGSTGGVRVELENSLLHTGIWQGESFTAGVPYDCETGVQVGSDYFFTGPTGYDGPMWDVKGTDAEVAADGTLTASASGNPELELTFPLEGATLDATDGWSGSIKHNDWSGATLATTFVSGSGGNFTVYDGTWSLLLTVTSGTAAPGFTVVHPGAATLRVGGCIDCSNESATFTGPPDWST